MFKIIRRRNDWVSQICALAAIVLVTGFVPSAAKAQLSQQGMKQVGTGGSGDERQGSSAALSADGNTAIEGGPNDSMEVGAVWFFTRSGGVWTQQGGKIVGTGYTGPAAPQQGTSVAISSDGNTAIEGAPQDGNSIGAAWVFTRSGGVWTQQGNKLFGSDHAGAFSSQGQSVALSGDGNTAAIGGPDDNGVGAVWIFTRSGGVWTQLGSKLVASGAGAGAGVGTFVALSTDGNTLIAGAPSDNGGNGGVFVFTQSGGVWTQQGAELLGSAAVGTAGQGTTVAVSSDGNTLVEGGPGDNSSFGATWVFTRSGGTWNQQGGKLMGTGNTGTFLEQGSWVGLSGDGNTFIEGGPGDASFDGAAWMFTRSGSTWSQLGGKLHGSGAMDPAQQGFSVALSINGGTAIVGGYNDNPLEGAVWFFAGNALSVSVTGGGTVTSADGSLNCTSSCSSTYLPGATATLTATPAVGSAFSGWGGACSGTGPCVVTMSAAKSVTATFTALPNFTLTVTPGGTGKGLVTSSPAGITCGSTCSASFFSGETVTLTASASTGSTFTGWSGGVCTGTAPCQVTVTADTNVTATFKKNVTAKMLSVALTGGGSGTVTSTPSGINCGPTCSASFQTGTQIILSAAASSGSTFAGWSGGGCSGIDGCALTLDAATTVTASFVANTAGNLTLVAAVLPTSRSVEIGATPTAFATMINAGPDNAATCTIAPATSVPASFLFQTTDPSTNAVTGTANTPTNIAAGQAGTFVIAFTPTAAFPPTDVAFTFTCANAPGPAASITGVNTLNLSASTTPVPDIVALAASGDPGYVDIPGATGTGVFAVATANLGIDATITAAANTGAANLPVTLLICQTDPTSGTCLASPAPTATTVIPPNATPTFGIFVTGSAPVADMPGVNRVFVTFTDSTGTLRGETSVAVRTQ
jgi:hypothetical protein